MASDFLKPLPIFCSQSQSQQSSRCRLTSLLSTTSLSQKPSTPPEPRHYRIFADYSTDFIWRDFNDLRFGEGDCVLEAEEVLSSFPPSVLQLYDAWVDTYNENFRERREKSQTYRATTFESVSEEVAWNVAGFLLAWRIAMAPQDQVDLLAKGKFVA
ncbi:hypothetical protein NUU61_006988 [Penicillium alfredii]|uniref:Uncharacterized protein n=1 Tax=Penicillium alfredii TaxID=1506179 RepID=A0A9W9F1W6_9EURO|nr:uncharacterized protein NUU61_006988 [Penicillium alfredii]KAJ5092118.1 hypothetical protein NUU61_006988 [Penicillium alfredii]